MSDTPFAPWKLGKREIRNRVVMAPMTRNRCPGNSPGEIVATYYSQRAEAGMILSGGYDRARAEADLLAKNGDLIAFGRPFISNPKLVTKLRNGSALLPADQATFYSPGEKGYIDYPT